MCAAGLLTLIGGCAARGREASFHEGTTDAPTLTELDTLLAGLPDNSELANDVPADAVYPRAFDLLADQSPVRDQGTRCTCSIFSTVALIESVYIHAGASPDIDLSEQYLNWSVKTQLGEGASVMGGNTAWSASAASLFGIPLESAWAYESEAWKADEHAECAPPFGADGMPLACRTNGDAPASSRVGAHYFASAGHPINSATNTIKDHLATAHTGVLIAAEVYLQAWSMPTSTLPLRDDYHAAGYVVYPNATDHALGIASPAGHAVLIVGWDDELSVQRMDENGELMVDDNGDPVMDTGFFLFKNSWGTSSLGAANSRRPGYGWISYRYVADYSRAFVLNSTSTETPAGRASPSNGSALLASSASPSAIPDFGGATLTSTIVVEEGARAVADLVVSIDIEHTRSSDLSVTLIAPSGESTTLWSRTDTGQTKLRRSFAVPFFEGRQAAGSWRLRVEDNEFYETGTLLAWSLSVAP